MKKIKKRVMARLATAAAVVPVAMVGVSSEASARNGEQVTWRNLASGRCLTHDASHEVSTMPQSDCSDGFKWTEHAIREDSSGQGVYRISASGFKGDVCLDSSDAGRVYLNPCNGSNYQKWKQVKTSIGWKLTNVATGRVLDSSDGGKVYTKPDNGGRYQRWT
ncbi:ricin-type beta-trefoil lectin domain protein [Streptomyces sp. NPDC001262]|uniref:RICIN domain-containing protein n=1 Tax=Streptomyces TaxID=1883 RepID=UPI0036A16EE5